jgi:hypothetical protein
VVKAFVRRAYEIARFGRVNDALMAITVRAARVVALAGPAMTTTLARWERIYQETGFEGLREFLSFNDPESVV